MLYSRRHLPFVIAACLVLRALVPIGYMLQVPAAGDNRLGLALLLCPTQNPGLKLDALGRGSDPAHHHHAPLTPPDDGAGLVIDVSSGCSHWLNSATAVFSDIPSLKIFRVNAEQTAMALPAAPSRPRRGHVEARAPPLFNFLA